MSHSQAEVKAADRTDEAVALAAASVERRMWRLYLLVGVIMVTSVLVVQGNTPHMSAWLLTLLAIGIGQALLMPTTVGWLGGLAVVVVWVLFRQAAGVWVRDELLQSLLEVISLSVSVVLAVRFRQVWQLQQEELEELRALRQVLVAGEVGTGLLPREVAELRILEEVDRASLFRRPLGLLLVELEPLPQLAESEDIDFADAYQAVSRQLIGASLVHDIPFRAGRDRIGLIMPERNWSRLYSDAEMIVERLKAASFLDREEQPRSVLQYIKLNVGLGTYQGEVQEGIDLVRAAEDSLSISRELAEVGEAPVSAYAMPAAPIVEPKLVLADVEE